MCLKACGQSIASCVQLTAPTYHYWWYRNLYHCHTTHNHTTCPHTIIPPTPPTATHYKVLLSVGAKEEEPKPAKRHKPLFTCEKTTSEPTSQACSSNCETSLSQESIVSPPLPIAALPTSSASSSLLASPLEPPSSQHTMVRWGPMSPAFLIKGQSLAALNLL